MKKLIGIKLLAIALIVVSLTTDTIAQSRIRFAKGRSAATVNGTLASEGRRVYYINVAEGQTLTIQLTSGNNSIGFDLDDVHGNIDHYDDGYAQIVTDAKGDHTITVINEGDRATKYTMTVSARW